MKKKIAVLLTLVLVIGLCLIGFTGKAYAREAQMYLVIPEDVKKEQEITVKVILESDVNLYSIDSYVSYDAQLLEFIPENDIVTGTNGIVEIKDVFGEETKYKEYELKFRTLDTGNAYINLTDIYLIDYEDLNYITVSSSEYVMDISVNENVAEDARLSDLLVAPGELSTPFDANCLSYEMYVGMDVESVGISAFAVNEESVVDVEMPEVLQEGENIIKITVTALSGNVNTYTIRVVKQEQTDVLTEENVPDDSEMSVMENETEEESGTPALVEEDTEYPVLDENVSTEAVTEPMNDAGIQ